MLKRMALWLGILLISQLTSYQFSMASSLLNVDVGSYAGSYRIDNSGLRTGNSVLSIEPGNHVFSNEMGSSFTFEVDTSGNVSIQDSIFADGVGSVLQLKTLSVEIDPANYLNSYELYGRVKKFGIATMVVIPGLSERVVAGASSTLVVFMSDISGVISLSMGQDNVTTSLLKITFRNISMVVNPGSYGRVFEVGGPKYFGLSTVVNIPNVTEEIINGSGVRIALYSQASDGGITVHHGADHVNVLPNEINFKNVSSFIDPGLYSNRYELGGFKFVGPASIVNIPDVQERILNGIGVYIADYIQAESGEITIVGGQASALGGNGILSFKNVSVSINPGSYTGTYSFLGGNAFSGLATQVNIPDVTELLNIGGANVAVTFSNGQLTIGNSSGASVSYQFEVMGTLYTLNFSTFADPNPTPIPIGNPVASHGGPYSVGHNSPVTVDGSGSSDPNGLALQYLWEFGDGTTANGVIATHLYAQAGTYQLTLTVTNTNGFSASASTTVNVLAPTQIVNSIENRIDSLLVGGHITTSQAFTLKQDIGRISTAVQAVSQSAVVPPGCIVIIGSFYVCPPFTSGGRDCGFLGLGCADFGGGGGINFGGLGDFGAAMNSFLSHLGEMNISLEQLRKILEDVAYLTRALAGDPAAIVEVLKMVMEYANQMGIIDDETYNRLYGYLDTASKLFAGYNIVAGLESMSQFTNEIADLSGEGVVTDGFNTIVGNMSDSLFSQFGPGTIIYAVSSVKVTVNQISIDGSSLNGLNESIGKKIELAMTYISEGNTVKASQTLTSVRKEIVANKKLTSSQRQQLLNNVDFALGQL